MLVLAHLRRAGRIVERVTDVLNARAPDREILAAARARDVVLLTHDQDFSFLLASSGATRPSPLNLRTTSVEPEFLGECIVQALHDAAADLAAGAVVTVEDGGIRVRRLQIAGR